MDALLPTLLENGVIDPTIENSLESKVKNAEKTSSKDNICAAIYQLDAFKNQINVQSGHKVSEEAAIMLIDYADNSIQQLLNSLPEGVDCN